MIQQDIQQSIASLLATVEKVTGQGAVYHGLHDRTLLTNDAVCRFCGHCLRHPATASFCRYAACSATMHALSSGEPYYYRCWAGLLFVTVAVAPGNQCRGGISAGGFYSLGEEGDIRETLSQRLSPLRRADLSRFLSHMPSIRRITPSALRGLGHFIMEATYSSGLNSAAFFRKQNEKYLQQRRIAEAAADIRLREIAAPDILGDTYQLVSLLHAHDPKSAQQFTSQYLAKLLMASNWDLTKLKAHVRVLLAIMTSQDILRGTPWAAATSREMRYMTRLEKARDTEESCYEVAVMIQEYFSAEERGRSEDRSVAERTVEWVQSHYAERPTLAAAAKAVGASVSTTVHRLKRETGKTFRQIVQETRVAEAKKLLATTPMEIAEIADRCGFVDQSHFTRSLKVAINLTPGRFRKLLRVPEEEVLK